MIDIKNASADELMERRSAIAGEIDHPEADLTALEEEARAISAELEARKAEAAAKKALRDKVAKGAGKEFEKKEKTEMTKAEFLDSKEYIDAFARYIKTDKDTECRALLTENGYTGSEGESGPLPVPTYIEGRIKTAWEKTGLMDLVNKTYLRGNVKIGFEVAATDAVVHVEGDAAPEEEELILGTVLMVPFSLKKWIEISDETVDMGGQEFLDYVFDEISYKIAKLAQETLLGMIATASTTASTTAVSVAEITSDGTDLLSIVSDAYSQLSDEAVNPVIVMNKLTFAEFRKAQASANYAFDPLEGLPVYYDKSLSTIGDTSAPWLIVGDFGVGAQANFPNGDEIKIKYDDLSQAPRDMVRITGREYVGLGLVADKAFCRVMSGEGGEVNNPFA